MYNEYKMQSNACVYQMGNLPQTYQVPGRMQFLFDPATLKGGMMLNTGGSVASE